MKDETPLLVPVLAALPVSACMLVLGLPAIGHGHAPAFRALFFVACLLWTMPLALLQRWMWRQGSAWHVMALALLVLTYLMSVLNAALGQRLAMGLGLETAYQWQRLFAGLDGCWLALIAFCAIHAVAAYYLALQRSQLRLSQAIAAARDAELRALRYQVNPHFLFNTLNAVSALVGAEENHAACRMLASVSTFLRSTLAHNGGHEHALADELALTDAYLTIEKARLGDRLRVSMQVGPGVLDAAVPFLLLQPLVENAVRHGVATRSAAGAIDIALRRAGTLLLLEVINDGAAPTPTPSDGIGLNNVAQRLHQLYGADQQLDAGWRADQRFSVRLTIPLRPMAHPA